MHLCCFRYLQPEVVMQRVTHYEVSAALAKQAAVHQAEDIHAFKLRSAVDFHAVADSYDEASHQSTLASLHLHLVSIHYRALVSLCSWTSRTQQAIQQVYSIEWNNLVTNTGGQAQPQNSRLLISSECARLQDAVMFAVDNAYCRCDLLNQRLVSTAVNRKQVRVAVIHQVFAQFCVFLCFPCFNTSWDCLTRCSGHDCISPDLYMCLHGKVTETYLY